MILFKPQYLAMVALFAAVTVATGVAAAEAFPSKTIHLVSGVTAGSASDTIARLLAEKLEASLGQKVIVENRLGAGGLIGAAYVAKSPPDGHIINIFTSAFTTGTLLSPNVLDSKDLAPVAALATVPTILIVPAEKGAKTIADLVATARAKPGQLNAVSAGVNSATHFNLERFRIAAGIDVLHVPMKGGPEAVTEVLAGRADFYFAPVNQVLKLITDGRVRALAVGSPTRSSALPDLPTTVEAGYPNSDYNFWVGALIAAKTPRAIVERLNRDFNAALSAPEIAEKFRKLGAEPLVMTLPKFEALIKEELESNARLIKAAGIKAQ